MEYTYTEFINSYGLRIMMTDCPLYEEDPCICDSYGEPKGQCMNCGGLWIGHQLSALPVEEQEFVREVQEG